MLRWRTLFVAMLLVSCSAGPAAEPSLPNESAPDPTPKTTSLAERESPTTTNPPTTSTTVTTVPEPFIGGLDVATIEAARNGDGIHPRLEWEPVLGASTYTVLVMDPDDVPWWSWSGPDTGVVLGGVETESEIGGPAAAPGVSWVVFAYDDQDRLVGVSPSMEEQP